MVASVSEKKPYRRIATEEAWISPELLALYQKMLKEGSSNDPGFECLWRHYGLGMSERCTAAFAALAAVAPQAPQAQRRRHQFPYSRGIP